MAWTTPHPALLGGPWPEIQDLCLPVICRPFEDRANGPEGLVSEQDTQVSSDTVHTGDFDAIGDNQLGVLGRERAFVR